MMDAVKSAIRKKNGTCILPRDQVNAISSIIYDIHILGDYVEGKPAPQKALQDLNDLTADIINSTQKLKSTDYDSLNKIRIELNNAKISGSLAQKAEAMLNVMERFIPKLIDSSPIVKSALH